MIEVSVKDTGVGMTFEEMDNVFDGFYQNEDRKTLKQQHNGITLSFC